MVRSLVRFLFRTVEQTLRKYGMVQLLIHLSFRQRQFGSNFQSESKYGSKTGMDQKVPPLC